MTVIKVYICNKNVNAKMRKYNIGDKISLKGKLIRGVIYDLFEQADTLYYVHTDTGDDVWHESDTSELFERVIWQRVKVIANFVILNWKVCLGVFLAGVIIGVII